MSGSLWGAANHKKAVLKREELVWDRKCWGGALRMNRWNKWEHPVCFHLLSPKVDFSALTCIILASGAGRGKDLPTSLSEDGKESQRPIRSQTHAARNRKKRRLNDLESDSTAAESEDEFMLSNRWHSGFSPDFSLILFAGLFIPLFLSTAQRTKISAHPEQTTMKRRKTKTRAVMPAAGIAKLAPDRRWEEWLNTDPAGAVGGAGSGWDGGGDAPPTRKRRKARKRWVRRQDWLILLQTELCVFSGIKKFNSRLNKY